MTSPTTAGEVGTTTVAASPAEPAPDGTTAAGPADVPAGRRRFTVASAVALALVAVPYVWTLWGPWESPNPLRTTIYEDNYYDLQARAMFHGHLWLPKGSIGIEAFNHDGHQYTYFGLFPSLLRMPVLLVTSRLDGRLTAPSMLLAWIVTALFAAALVWRVRVLLRGSVAMGWPEAIAGGALVATVTGGSVLVYLAETPFVFNEDIAWSVALTVGATFALLGMAERPTWLRLLGCGALILAANLDRLTTGWACVIGAVLLAVWFRSKRPGDHYRRWFWPMVLAGIVPLLVGLAVNWLKFGVPFGPAMTEQVWSMVNAHRRQFLASNHGSEVGLHFLPSDALAYLRPDGLGVTGSFPFLTLPAIPAVRLSGILFDRVYRTASMPSSMPLLFLAGAWGVVVAFLPGRIARPALVRILLVATAAAGGALLLWGYISERYLGDYVPFLALAAAVGFVDLWRRASGRGALSRGLLAGAVVALAVLSVAINVGIAIVPSSEFSMAQTRTFVTDQHVIDEALGLAGPPVRRVRSLPGWAPAGQLDVVGSCAGLYVSDGEYYRTVPLQYYERATWLPVELGPAYEHVFDVTAGSSAPGSAARVPLVSIGPTTVAASATPLGGGRLRLTFVVTDPRFHVGAVPTVVRSGQSVAVDVTTDVARHALTVTVDGVAKLQGPFSGTGRVTIDHPGGARNGPLSVVATAGRQPTPTLCRTLDRSARP